MSWGTRITILCVGFVCFMTFLVIKAMHQNFDLVADDYYKKEIQFQDQLDKQINHESLTGTIELKDSANFVIFNFPEEFLTNSVDGEITFFRPSDATKDFVQKIDLIKGKQMLDKKFLINGLYRIKIDYSVNGKSYYFEESLII